jgi:branched-chain amino acid aminotransferase
MKKRQMKGFDQVLWLYDKDHQISEVGTMNIFFIWLNEKGEKEIITPSIEDLVLPGLTRQTCIDILLEWGYVVNERKIYMDEIVKSSQENRVKLNIKIVIRGFWNRNSIIDCTYFCNILSRKEH